MPKMPNMAFFLFFLSCRSPCEVPPLSISKTKLQKSIFSPLSKRGLVQAPKCNSKQEILHFRTDTDFLNSKQIYKFLYSIGANNISFLKVQDKKSQFEANFSANFYKDTSFSGKVRQASRNHFLQSAKVCHFF